MRTNLLKNKSTRVLCLILGLVAVVFIMVWARAFYGSVKDYQKGEIYLKGQHYIKAVTFFDRSIRWYTPFNPYIQKSAQRLWEIGNHAEQEGDVKLALIAFRTIRRGFYAAGSFITPGKSWIEKCDLKISELMAMEDRGTDDFTPSKKTIFQSQERVSPSIFWSIILEIGFLGWIGSVIGFIIFILGRKGEGRYLHYSAFIWIGLTFVFFALWVLGMMKA